MCLPADDPGRPPHQSPRHAFARGNRAASPTLANRAELLPLSSLYLLPYYPQPSARHQAAEQPCVPYRRQLYTERIKRMMQRPTERTAERKAARIASPLPQYFLPDCLPKNGPADQSRSSLTPSHRHPAMDESCRKGQSRRKLCANHPAPRSMAA